MLLWIILLNELLSSAVNGAAHRGPSISCACSTTQCAEHGSDRCNTTGLCFSQYLERADGSHPVVRGCISGRTPLLCENRRPAVASRAWPLLLCCSSNMCNLGVVPTAPPWHTDPRAPAFNQSSTSDRISKPSMPSSAVNSTVDLPVSSSNDSQLSTPQEPQNPWTPPPRHRAPSFPHIVSPVYVSVLILGVVSLAIIGVVAAIVLRRSNRLYGTLGQHQGCPKHRMGSMDNPVVQCECDSVESDSIGQRSLQFVHVVYDRQTPNDT